MPSPSPRYGAGDTHGVGAAPSRLHSNVGLSSLAEKLNEMSVWLVRVGWMESRKVSGAIVSTVQVRLSGEASVLPAPSDARTSNVCVPSSSPVSCRGEPQAANDPLSS